jgi:hypothetical protein
MLHTNDKRLTKPRNKSYLNESIALVVFLINRPASLIVGKLDNMGDRRYLSHKGQVHSESCVQKNKPTQGKVFSVQAQCQHIIDGQIATGSVRH